MQLKKFDRVVLTAGAGLSVALALVGSLGVLVTAAIPFSGSSQVMDVSGCTLTAGLCGFAAFGVVKFISSAWD